MGEKERENARVHWYMCVLRKWYGVNSLYLCLALSLSLFLYTMKRVSVNNLFKYTQRQNDKAEAKQIPFASGVDLVTHDGMYIQSTFSVFVCG